MMLENYSKNWYERKDANFYQWKKRADQLDSILANQGQLNY